MSDNSSAELPPRNKMGEMPIGKLLFTMAVPMVISMLVQALYNIVDSIYIGHLPNSEDALTAVGLAFPLQILMIAFAVGTSVGMNSLISRRLGERRNIEANAAAVNGLFLEAVSALVFLVLGLTVVKPFFHLFTSNSEVIRLGVGYLRICMIFGFGCFFHCGIERILQSMGKTGLTMVAQLAAAITNIVLDPILIFGYLGFPAMGVEGAAIATVIGQMVGMAVSVLMLAVGKHEVKVSLRGFRPDWHIIKEIYHVGLPAVIMQAIGSVMNVGMNLVLSRILLSEMSVGVMGIYYKTQSLVFMPLIGITNAAMSIMAYNFGARNIDRLQRVWKTTLLVCIGVMLIGLACFQIFPQNIASVFDESGAIGRNAVPAFRIISLHFPIAAFCITSSVLFQAVGRGFYSMVISLLRQLGALLPAAVMLALATGSVNAVWWSFPIAEFVSLCVCALFLTRLNKNVLKPIKAEGMRGDNLRLDCEKNEA